MLSTFRIALAAALLAGSGSVLASEPQREAAAASSADQGARTTQPQRRPAPSERLVCRTVEVAGSGGAMPMVCMPAADWERAPQ